MDYITHRTLKKIGYQPKLTEVYKNNSFHWLSTSTCDVMRVEANCGGISAQNWFLFRCNWSILFKFNVSTGVISTRHWSFDMRWYRNIYGWTMWLDNNPNIYTQKRCLQKLPSWAEQDWFVICVFIDGQYNSTSDKVNPNVTAWLILRFRVILPI